MRAWIEGFADQLRRPVELELPSNIPQPPRSLIALGMGGSAIGAQMAAGLISDHSPIPIYLQSQPGLPAFASSKDVVIAVSYSGNTDETLKATREALDRGISVVAITCGGQLEELVGNQAPLIRLPGGISPRAAFGHLFSSFLHACGKFGLTKLPSDLENIASQLEQRSAEYLDEKGEEAKLAERLVDGLPVIIGSGPTTPVAHRFRCQLNENAKMVAFDDELPEMNHNSVVGWADEAREKHLIGIAIKGGWDDRSTGTLKLLEPLVADWIELEGSGNNLAERLLDLVHRTDAISWHCARLKGVDPVSVRMIDELKAHLAID